MVSPSSLNKNDTLEAVYQYLLYQLVAVQGIRLGVSAIA